MNEVKRQAVIELQKAVAAAEAKANELVSSEKVKMERAVNEMKKKTRDEVLNAVNRQEESSEVRTEDRTLLIVVLFIWRVSSYQ